MKKSKRILLSLLMMFLLVGLVGCASNDGDQEPVVKNPVVDADEDEDETEDADELDEIDEMIKESKYISKIKLITKGEKASEIKVLDNIKDIITPDRLPELTLEENRVYLVFLKDDGNQVVLTDDEGVVLLESDNHELFEKINKQVNR